MGLARSAWKAVLIQGRTKGSGEVVMFGAHANVYFKRGTGMCEAWQLALERLPLNYACHRRYILSIMGL